MLATAPLLPPQHHVDYATAAADNKNVDAERTADRGGGETAAVFSSNSTSSLFRLKPYERVVDSSTFENSTCKITSTAMVSSASSNSTTKKNDAKITIQCSSGEKRETATSTDNKNYCCDDCRRVDEKVKFMRDELHFLTHQIVQIMHTLRVEQCRCAACDLFLLSTGENQTQNVQQLQQQNRREEREQVLTSGASLLMAFRLQQQQQKIRDEAQAANEVENLQQAESETTVNKNLSPSSSATASPSNSVEDKLDEYNVKKEHFSSEEISEETGKINSDDDAVFSGAPVPKKRHVVVGVDQLLPKLLAVTEVDGKINESQQSAAFMAVSLTLGDASNFAQQECRRRRFSDAFDADENDEENLVEADSEDTVSPVDKEDEKRRMEQSGLHENLHGVPSALLQRRTHFSSDSSPPLKKMSRIDYLRHNSVDSRDVIAPAFEQSCFLRNGSPCSSGGSVELPKNCVDVAAEGLFDNDHGGHHHNGLLVTNTHRIPSTSIAASLLHHHQQQQLKGFAANFPAVSAGLPLIMQGPKTSTFFCTICKREFSNVYYKRHMIVHANARPYICDVCGKRFNERSNMMKHKQRLHGP